MKANQSTETLIEDIREAIKHLQSSSKLAEQIIADFEILEKLDLLEAEIKPKKTNRRQKNGSTK